MTHLALSTITSDTAAVYQKPADMTTTHESRLITG